MYPGSLDHLATVMNHELAWRQKNMIACGCYDNVNLVTGIVGTTAPVRPVGNVSSVTGHVTVQVNQFYGCQTSTRANFEPAKLVILRPKTYWGEIHLSPSICK